MQTYKPLCIIGAGDAAQSTYFMLKQGQFPSNIVAFIETDDYFQARTIFGIPVWPLSRFDPERFQALIAIANPQDRWQLAQQMPPKTEFASFIHPECQILSPEDLSLGEGSVIFPYCLISRNVQIGKHAFILSYSILGHDIEIGDFFTASARLSTGGHCTLGTRVICGMSVSLRDKVHIADDVVLGMGSIVLKDLLTPGTYVGNPATLLKP